MVALRGKKVKEVPAMRAKTQTLNEQIRLLMNDFTGQAVNLYGQ